MGTKKKYVRSNFTNTNTLREYHVIGNSVMAKISPVIFLKVLSPIHSLISWRTHDMI